MSGSKTLLFDIGNTRLKWGVLSEGRIARTGSVSHAVLQEKGFASLTTRLPHEVGRVVASNVAGPTFATQWSKLDVLAGREIVVDRGGIKQTGIARGIATDGALLLHNEEGLQRIISGSVSTIDCEEAVA